MMPTNTTKGMMALRVTSTCLDSHSPWLNSNQHICAPVSAIHGPAQSTQRHKDCAQPDPANKRLVVKPNRPALIVIKWLAECDLDIPGKSGINGGFGHGVLLHEVGAFFGIE